MTNIPEGPGFGITPFLVVTSTLDLSTDVVIFPISSRTLITPADRRNPAASSSRWIPVQAMVATLRSFRNISTGSSLITDSEIREAFSSL